MSTTLAGQVCIVTGANRGIGEAAARGLAALGARVVMVARDASAGENARDAIVAKSGNRDVVLEVADLAVQSETRALAGRLLASEPAIHVLVNNAAVLLNERTTTPDGIEATFAIDHLAPFLLTTLLLPRLTASAPARIVTVASEAHQGLELDFDDLQHERNYDGVRVYGRAKLANIMFTYELARRLAGTGVTANTLHPGVIGTKLLGEYFGGYRLGRPAFRMARGMFGTPDKGASTILHLAASPQVASVNGGYFIDSRPAKSSAASLDRAAQRRLWEASAALTGLAAETKT